MNSELPYPVHPAAECVRLMTEEELATLAADIAEHGQADPITLGRINGHVATWLVDGRNRARACSMAGIDPVYETREFKDDDEIKAFVTSKNERRDISKGQKAMAVAWNYPDPEKGGRGKKGKASETNGFSQVRLREARAVLAHSRDLAIAVRDGTLALDLALDKVKTARDTLTSTEAMISRLRTEAPDLADLVEEERMKPKEAIGALDTRIEEAERKRISATQLLASLVNTWHPRTADPADYAERITENVDPKHWPKLTACDLTKNDLRAVAQVVTALAEMADKWEVS
jgi:ParB-like nuclease domain